MSETTQPDSSEKTGDRPLDTDHTSQSTGTEYVAVPLEPEVGSNEPDSKSVLAIRAAIVIAILAGGLVIMRGLAGMKKQPPKLPPRQPELVVDLLTAQATNVLVNVDGYGVVRSLRNVELSPEVSGTIIDTFDDLRAGVQVKKGSVLWQVDPRDYENAVLESKAQIAQTEATLKKLETQRVADEARIDILKRNEKLAVAEYERVKRLFDENKVGSISAVDATELAMNNAKTQVVSLQQALDLYPSQIEEAKSTLQAAESRLARAELNLARCTVVAPFDGRIVDAMIEEGQLATPGRIAVKLADDSLLEIHVKVDSSDLRQWLPFSADSNSAAWFAPLETVPVTITWTEASEELSWTGELHRVVSFDATTRTATVAVRVSSDQAHNGSSVVPLVDGMFVKVQIPGATLSNVFAIPRAAVTFDNKAYLSVSNKLQTVDVRVRRSQGQWTYVDQGIQEGDTVIVTRLVAPLEGIQIKDVKQQDEPGNGE